MKDPVTAEVFKAQIGDKITALNILDNDIDTICNNIKDVLLSSAEEVLRRERRNNKQLVTTELVDLCDKRRELRHKKYTSLDYMTKYQKANREVRMKLKEVREEWIKEQCIIIDKEITTGRSKKAYSTLKTLTKPSHPKASVISDADGNLLIVAQS